MFNSSSTNSLRSINDCNVKPKRTSYDKMSTWIYMDTKTLQKPPPIYMNFDYFKSSSELTFPPIGIKNIRRPAPKDISSNRLAVRDFLMKNWTCNSYDLNKSLYLEPIDRKGKSGSWAHITEAFKEDGNRIVFVNGPSIVGPPAPRQVEPKPVDPRESIRLTVQTRQGIESRNWNIIR